MPTIIVSPKNWKLMADFITRVMKVWEEKEGRR